MERIELGFFMNWALNGSKELENQRSAAVRQAAGPIGDKDFDAFRRGQEMFEDLKRARVTQTVLPS